MYQLDYKQYAQTARQLGADSCVLLKNDGVLPIQTNQELALFGRCQIDTYYCGTGSGGMVNLPYLITIQQGLEELYSLNQEVLQQYEDFIKDHPFDKGKGWAQEPWSQEEMPLTKELVKKAATTSSIGLFVIGRSAGEDKDSAAVEGSYYLSKTEYENIRLLTKHFSKTIVLLNIGGIMDMQWAEELSPNAILCGWHCGCETGHAYAALISGAVNPSGSLANTIGKQLTDYPSHKNFGDLKANIYEEDIFVGYRYFETFAPEQVYYPFGFGLSYTTFSLTPLTCTWEDSVLTATVKLTNTGNLTGKKAVQLYIEAPQGHLGKAKKVLVDFQKSKLLAPTEEAVLTFVVPQTRFTSFDEEASCFLLEQGLYYLHVGLDVHSTTECSSFEITADIIVEQCSKALEPIVPFTKMVCKEIDGVPTTAYEQGTIGDSSSLICTNSNPTPLEQTHYGYTFQDVLDENITISEFANELSDLECIWLSRGEGMCSPKVTPGTAGAFGGVTESLKAKRIPIACCSDGPSGIRMDNGSMAFSIPNGTAIACSFDTKLTEKIFDFLGLELIKNNIDTLLGPGINIHRHPLCGRNFEYSSEDPLLTGKMAVAELKAFHKYHVTGTLKHFACNNQETGRREVDAIVSTRALREIYLKAFEIAVKEGEAFSIMTAYNPVNGIQSASNHPLNTTILREDWGYQGVVMTDWWATMNTYGEKASIKNTHAMILAQNDVYMVNADAFTNSNEDTSETALASGILSRADLIRGAENILYALSRFACKEKSGSVEVHNLPEVTTIPIHSLGLLDLSTENKIDASQINTEKGILNQLVLRVKEKGNYRLVFDVTANAVALAQLTMTVTINRFEHHTHTLQGGTSTTISIDFGVYTSIDTYVEIYFSETGMEINGLILEDLGSSGNLFE